ncbi:NAD(P)-dependent dehydrogenase (short-subunit alcohol dehydrogenase family) [Altererythrobacter atlanticus]|uniref:Sorbitol dehydrogenase n=1 Tax=Croceibacterium atlanticum TaxID=1267766 RepID=A0A0F7KQL6_9SPHN|nr:SDR family NAD(P)-dependent oxidoreductase [Croceibacterium atlanticum]AKH41105.1 Sorbitol dehydrogenase [Croceibacterium atlanticum]MBB5732620.1 NAD(P)-dependent dehydrogenase (short-subunit alcohol dehydrogenase family) [Croceibacterium atlanticum]
MPIESFDGKTAFITGGASGIGLGIAQVLVERGAKVVLADLRQDHIDNALARFAGGGQSNAVSALQLDVTNREAYREAAARMQKEFGGIDILVNNAGVGLEGPILEATYADYDFGFGVNVGGVINGFIEFLPQMVAHGRGGHIVSTASLAAEVVMPPHLAIYAASKAAVCHYCEAVKPELMEKGIGVSILLPGPVKSNIHETQQNRPAHLLEGSGFKDSEKKLSRRIVGENWMEPEEAGMLVADGILANQTYIITHGFYKDAMRARAQAVLGATPDKVEDAPDFGRFREEDG